MARQQGHSVARENSGARIYLGGEGSIDLHRIESSFPISGSRVVCGRFRLHHQHWQGFLVDAVIWHVADFLLTTLTNVSCDDVFLAANVFQRNREQLWPREERNDLLGFDITLRFAR